MANEEPERLAWIRLQRCRVAVTLLAHTPCSGMVEPDHLGRRPYGRKAHDNTAIPLCRDHHRERTDASGTFKTWQQEDFRRWQNEQIAIVRGVYDQRSEGIEYDYV